MDDEPIRPMHVWGPSYVGHGEAQCVRCLMTNREAQVLGPYCLAPKKEPKNNG